MANMQWFTIQIHYANFTYDFFNKNFFWIAINLNISIYEFNNCNHIDENLVFERHVMLIRFLLCRKEGVSVFIYYQFGLKCMPSSFLVCLAQFEKSMISLFFIFYSQSEGLQDLTGIYKAYFFIMKTDFCTLTHIN